MYLRSIFIIVGKEDKISSFKLCISDAVRDLNSKLQCFICSQYDFFNLSNNLALCSFKQTEISQKNLWMTNILSKTLLFLLTFLIK